MSEQDPSNGKDMVVERTADIVAAYVGNHVVALDDVGRLISDVHAALTKTLNRSEGAPVTEKQKPAVSIRKSLQDNYLTCLECGSSFKSLKRHLTTHHDLAPEEYREKWDLPSDYPMVAPSYAQARSDLAKSIGLGKKLGHHR
jgi:predicted transcriptional regulator